MKWYACKLFLSIQSNLCTPATLRAQKSGRCSKANTIILPYILAYKSENFGHFFVYKKMVRLIRESLKKKIYFRTTIVD